jgi:hypothetical protein
MKKGADVIIGVMMCLFSLSGIVAAVDSYSQAQLPADVKIERPGQEISGDIADLMGPTGKWGGQWETSMEGQVELGQFAKLVVEKISPTQATVVWAVGDSKYSNRPGSAARKQVQIQLRNGRQTIVFPSNERGKEFTFWREGATLKGSDSFRRSIVMTAIP